MRQWSILLGILVLVIGIYVLMQFWSVPGKAVNQASHTATPDSLVIVWTSGDRDVALKMVFMYALNAKKYEWWKDVTLIVWGPSAQLLSRDEELQAKISEMQQGGVVLKACKGCSDQYGVSEKLSDIGIDVKYIGKELTENVKSGKKILTF